MYYNILNVGKSGWDKKSHSVIVLLHTAIYFKCIWTEDVREESPTILFHLNM